MEQASVTSSPGLMQQILSFFLRKGAEKEAFLSGDIDTVLLEEAFDIEAATRYRPDDVLVRPLEEEEQIRQSRGADEIRRSMGAVDEEEEEEDTGELKPLFSSLEGGVVVQEKPAATAAEMPAPNNEVDVTPPPPPMPLIAVNGLLDEDGIRIVNPLTFSVDIIHEETSWPSLSDIGGSEILKPLSHSIESLMSIDYTDILSQCDLRWLRKHLHEQQSNVRMRQILRPDLEKNFRDFWRKLAEKYPLPEQKNLRRPRLCFHGTKKEIVPKIVETGLKVPDGTIVKHTCDTGWWGKGIYVSFDPDYSGGYAEDGRLIVCVALLGKVYHCAERRDGGILEPGFDSHVAENGLEWVLFENSQLLPLFLVERKDVEAVPVLFVPPVAPPAPPPLPLPLPHVCGQCLKAFATETAKACHQNNLYHFDVPPLPLVCEHCLKRCKSHAGYVQHKLTKVCMEKNPQPWNQVKKK